MHSSAQMSPSKGSKGSPMPKYNTICVFGGSQLGKDEAFRRVAYDLGRALAARKINLVYGGGVRGLKGCIANSAITKGSRVLGVALKDEDSTSFTLGTELKVLTMHERMGYMLHNADAFIALPGGLGTLEEISSIIFWANKNIHRKPLGLLNVNGFYDGFLSFLDGAVEQEFIPQAMRSIIVSASTPDQLLDMLQNPSSELSHFKKQVHQPNEDGSKKRKLDTTLRL